MNALLRKLLFSLEPETAHKLSILALKSGLPLAPRPRATPLIETTAAGLNFPNPLGIAAGYDKDGKVPAQLFSLGFGFVEVGSVTPKPQPGNSRPRIFRLRSDEAVINRLGFNNEGHAACLARLEAEDLSGRIVGLNIGANKETEDKTADYEAGIDAFAHLASYFVVNISSPNTPGLRNLQSRGHLSQLLARTTIRRDDATVRTGNKVPVFLKIAPDLDEQELDDIAMEIEANGIEGLIVSNTTLDRSGLTETQLASQSGGLSGRPLFEKSTTVLAKMRKRCGPKLAIIGVGGINSPETALEKIRAGADLVQLYTGFIYGGPSLPSKIVKGLQNFASREGLSNISEVRGLHVDVWASKKH
ncbi:MAG: quinone-dependent dihydroorotate dehydrogenase [Rhizobiaceae bacterium]